ncbi:DUF7146 domain-containing protein [Azospirillum sp. sgz302134]
MTNRLHTVDQIVDMMRARIVDLIQGPWALKGHMDGRDFVCPSPLRADRRAGSFRICLQGSYKGMVKDFASGETWTPLSFTAALMFRGDNSEALRWTRAWLGLDGRDPEAIRQTRVAVEQAKDEPDDDGSQYRGTAHRRYLEARESILDTPVEAYLRGRGLDVRRFLFPMRSLRYHPSLHNKESGRAWPAMVAPIVGADGKFLGLHRTWLEVRADGRVTKAPLEEPKKALGGYRGGMIRLWNGTRSDPNTGEIRKAPKLAQAKPGVWIDITEGIEDGISVALAMQELRVAAGVSVDNICALSLPPCVAGLTLWAQNDEPDSPADKQFRKTVDRLLARGLRLRVPRPPEGFKDVNEWLQAMNERASA